MSDMQELFQLLRMMLEGIKPPIGELARLLNKLGCPKQAAYHAGCTGNGCWLVIPLYSIERLPGKVGLFNSSDPRRWLDYMEKVDPRTFHD